MLPRVLAPLPALVAMPAAPRLRPAMPTLRLPALEMPPALLTLTGPPKPKAPTLTVLLPKGSMMLSLPELMARMPAEKRLLALPVAMVPY